MAEEEQRRKLQKPTTTLTEAAALARSLYALDVGPGLKPLDSYDDRNFYVPTTTQGIFLLKIHNGVESANVAVLEAQNAVMCHLKARGFDCPVPVASVGGNDIEFVKAAIGEGGAAPRRFAVRLLTWVEGRTLNSLTATRARLLSAGAYLGRLRGALADFDHPGCHREHLWDINSTSGLTRFVSALDDAPDVQSIVRSVVQSFDAIAPASLAQLPKSVLQADFNDANIIFDAAGTRVSGVIDFGDTVYSNSINDLAIAMAYSMLQPPAGMTVVETAATVLEGYCRTAHVSAAEMALLRVLAACRLATSVTLGAFSSLQDTADNEYLALHAAPGRAALCAFWNAPAEVTQAVFEAAAEAAAEEGGKK
jgi:hydroxylysine kinase